MWRALLKPDPLVPGTRIKKELFLGNGDVLWTEYEVLETDESGVLLKPLRSCGHEQPNDPGRYKKMSFEFLYRGSTRIWDTRFHAGSWLEYKPNRLY